MLTLMGGHDSVNLFSSRKPLLGWMVILLSLGQLFASVSTQGKQTSLSHAFTGSGPVFHKLLIMGLYPQKPSSLVYLPSYPAILLCSIRNWVLAVGSSTLEQPFSRFPSLSSPQECSVNSGWKGKTGWHSVELGFPFPQNSVGLHLYPGLHDDVNFKEDTLVPLFSTSTQ